MLSTMANSYCVRGRSSIPESQAMRELKQGSRKRQTGGRGYATERSTVQSSEGWQRRQPQEYLLGYRPLSRNAVGRDGIRQFLCLGETFQHPGERSDQGVDRGTAADEARWQVFVPVTLGCQERQYGRIPPNSALVFEIELLAVESGPLLQQLDQQTLSRLPKSMTIRIIAQPDQTRTQ